MNDRAFISLMRLLPKASLSRAVGVATRLPAPARLHQAAAQVFSKAYRVDLDEAERPLGDYPTFGSFFTRRLKDGARPIVPGDEVVVSPVDGTVSEVGTPAGGRLLQAKGMDYTLAALLADAEQAERFVGGAFVFPGGAVDPIAGGAEAEPICRGRPAVAASQAAAVNGDA